MKRIISSMAEAVLTEAWDTQDEVLVVLKGGSEFDTHIMGFDYSYDRLKRRNIQAFYVEVKGMPNKRYSLKEIKSIVIGDLTITIESKEHPQIELLIAY